MNAQPDLMQAAPLPSRDVLLDILRSGIRAPSAENKHYLRFEIAADAVRLLSTDVGSWPELPHRRTLALLSYGAVVENMALRAGARGLEQTTRWWPDASHDALVAECRWTATTAAGDPLQAAIEQRHTNRRFYQRRTPPAATLDRLSNAAATVEGAMLSWLDTPPRRSLALQAIRVAETERFRRPALHRELFSAIRFGEGWARSTDEGLAPGTLEVEPPMRLPFAALRRWPAMRALSLVGGHHLLGLRAADLPCRLAPRLGLIVCGAESAALGALHAGRALQRVWLAATAEGLAFQPMAASVALVRQRPGGGWVSEQVQQRLIQVLEQLSGRAADTVYMVFRVGYAQAPSVVSGRPPIEDFLAA